MINKHSNIVKNCASAAEKVAGIFAYFKEMCNNTIQYNTIQYNTIQYNTISVAITLQQYNEP